MWIWRCILDQERWENKVWTLPLLSLVFTFCIWIPVFAILQVHVDICTQLWSAGVEHTKDFVLVKSSFLKKKKKTAHEFSPFQMQTSCHTHSMELIPDSTTVIRTRRMRKWVGFYSRVQKRVETLIWLWNVNKRGTLRSE